MSFSRKIIFIVAIPLLLDLVFLAALIAADRRSARYRLWQSSSTEAILATTELVGLMNQAEAATNGYVATGYAPYLALYESAIGEMPGKLRLLKVVTQHEYDAVTTTIPDLHGVPDLERYANITLRGLREDIDLVHAGRQPEAQARLKAGKTPMDDFRLELAAFRDEEVAVQHEQQARLLRAESAARIVVIVLLACNVGITPFFVWFLMRNVGRRIHHIVENMSRLGAGEQRLPAQAREDAIGHIDRGFHEMADRLRTADELLQREKEELQRLNAEKNRFLGMAAHDLRNPLFAVLAFTEVLIRRGGMPEPDHKLLQQIAKISRSMKALVDDFLDISAIEAGELRLRMLPVELGSVVAECVALQQHLAVQKDIRLRFTKNGDSTVLMDADKICQVVINLLTNALKFSPAGSAVDVSMFESGEAVRVAVADRGPGISIADRDRLFRPFSVASARATDGETSTGLGLAICRKIVEGHAGRIWVEGNEGGGSVFLFELAVAH